MDRGNYILSVVNHLDKNGFLGERVSKCKRRYLYTLKITRVVWEIEDSVG